MNAEIVARLQKSLDAELPVIESGRSDVYKQLETIVEDILARGLRRTSGRSVSR